MTNAKEMHGLADNLNQLIEYEHYHVWPLKHWIKNGTIFLPILSETIPKYSCENLL